MSHLQVLPADVGYEMRLKEELARLGSREDHAQGLLYVGLFKLSKFVFFAAVGVGALHLIHRDLAAEVLRLTDALRLGPESHVASFLLDKAGLIDHHRLRQASLFAFLYSALCLIEGVGLVLRRVWAEYFTLTLTVLGLPWEAFELLMRFTWLKVGVMAVNVVVLLYLLWVLKRKHEYEGRG